MNGDARQLPLIAIQEQLGISQRHCGNCYYTAMLKQNTICSTCDQLSHWLWQHDPAARVLDGQQDEQAMTLARQFRPGWDQYFMQLATVVATRSTCLRRQVGALAVKDRQIISTGYNGAPKGVKHCYEVGCLREQLNVPSGERHELCRSNHGEANALMQAAKNGVSTDGGYIYCTDQPCSLCMKMLINAGIRKAFYLNAYPDELSSQLAKEAGVELIHMQPTAAASDRP